MHMKNLHAGLTALFVLGILGLTAQQNSVAVQQAEPQPNANPQNARVPAGVKAFRDLAYVTDGHARQKLDLYVPEKANGPLPVIVWIHGGGWAAGSKDGCPPLNADYTRHGYAVASIGYRLSSDAIFPAQIEDCKAAIRWLRAHAKDYNLDPDHIAVWGSSAGGHLVALLGTSDHVKDFDVGENLDQSSRVQAVCDYYGPTDLLQMDEHALPTAFLKHDAANSPEAMLIGGPIQEHKEAANKANPISYVTKDAPPFLIVHGDKDPLVPHHQSELLYEALKSAGTQVRFHTLEGAGHGDGFGGRELDTIVRDFFERNLKGEAQPEEPRASETRGPAVIQQPIRWEIILKREDTDKDGRITKSEFKRSPLVFMRLDKNSDGVLTSDDFETARKQ
jgi:acetyl esterase/lipase